MNNLHDIIHYIIKTETQKFYFDIISFRECMDNIGNKIEEVRHENNI
mgnify:CR=1 FL=1